MDIAGTKLEALSRAVLYEGHSLFPYTRSAVKNTKSIPFGVVYPREYAERHPEVGSVMQTECLVTGGPDLCVRVTVRFLQRLGAPGAGVVEREVTSDEIPLRRLVTEGVSLPIHFAALSGTVALIAREVEGGHTSALPPDREPSWARSGHECETMVDTPMPSATPVPRCCEPGTARAPGPMEVRAPGGQYQDAPVKSLRPVFRLTARIINTTLITAPATASREEVFPWSFLSAHTILTVTGGKFLSVLEPEAEWRSAAEQCQNFGTWPVLVGENDRIVLSSPIILYDHPQIADTSTGDLFDATEIEEALLLHLSVLPEAEKNEIAGADEKLRQMLARAGSVTPEQMWKLHGTCHELPKPKDPR